MTTIGSLCSGYGGIELALSSVLETTLEWFAEFEDAPAKVMTHHHPGVPNMHDLTKIDWTTVAPVDVLTAGFPCQPFEVVCANCHRIRTKGRVPVTRGRSRR